MKKVILFSGCMLLLLGLTSSSAQAQFVFSSASGSFSNSSISLAFSAGEVITPNFSNSTISFNGGIVGGAGVTVSNEDVISDLPDVFLLNQNYPNPFNPTTNIRYQLPKSASVVLEVYNSIGSKVATLENAQKAAGVHTISFNASNYASGMYFYTLRANGQVISTKKMLLIK